MKSQGFLSDVRLICSTPREQSTNSHHYGQWALVITLIIAHTRAKQIMAMIMGKNNSPALQFSLFSIIYMSLVRHPLCQRYSYKYDYFCWLSVSLQNARVLLLGWRVWRPLMSTKGIKVPPCRTNSLSYILFS